MKAIHKKKLLQCMDTMEICIEQMERVLGEIQSDQESKSEQWQDSEKGVNAMEHREYLEEIKSNIFDEVQNFRDEINA